MRDNTSDPTIIRAELRGAYIAKEAVGLELARQSSEGAPDVVLTALDAALQAIDRRISAIGDRMPKMDS